MSPTTIFSPLYRTADVHDADWPAGRCTRGVGGRWVAGWAIPVPYPYTIPGPIFTIFLALSPTHGQMKAFLEVSVRFLRKGLE